MPAKKPKGPPPKVFKIPVGKGGRKSIPALLPLVDHNDLNISRSYYNKLLRKVKNNEPLPKTLPTKIENIRNVRNKHVLELRTGTKTNVIVEPYLKNILKTNKEKEFIWVKFKLGSAGRTYMQSFTTSKDNLKSISKQINDYLQHQVKKYDKYPVYVYEISIQNV